MKLWIVSFGTGMLDPNHEVYLPVIKGIFTNEKDADALQEKLEKENSSTADSIGDCKFYAVYQHVIDSDTELEDFAITC